MNTKQARTDRKADVLLSYICAYQAGHRRTPSRKEMANFLDTSTSVVNYYLTNLQSRGKIEPLQFNATRHIVITGAGDKIFVIYVCPKCANYSTTPENCPHHPDLEMVITTTRECNGD